MKMHKRLLAIMLMFVVVLTTVFGTTTNIEVYAASKAVTVETQKQLDAALKNSKVSKITIKSSAKKTLSIKKGTYSKKTLVVKGNRLTISNAGTFRSITVQDASKYTEKAKNNSIVVTDSKLSLVVDKAAVTKSVKLAKSGAKNTLTVNGTLKNLNVTKKSTITLNGSKASKTSIVTGAAGVTFVNNASKKIVVKDKEGNAVTIKAGKKGVTGNSNEDTTKPEDTTKSEDTTKPEDTAKPEDTTKPGDTNSSYIPVGPWGGSDNTASAFASAIENAKGTDGVYTVTLSNNVNGNVNAVFNQAGKLVIDCKNFKISGSFKLTAPDATKIDLNDSGVDTNGAVITGDLEIDAPKAHVENYVTVNGTVKVDKVADNTFVLFDKAAKFEVWGSGKISFANNLTNVPKVDIKTAEQVTLDGGIDEVEIQKPDAKIAVTSGNSIEKLVVPSGMNGTTVSGEGRIASLSVAAPVKVETDVDSIVVSATEAEITVSGNSSVKNVTVANGVSEVKIVGHVDTIDVSAAGDDVMIDAANVGKIVVKDQTQAQKIAAQDSALESKLVYITHISVVYNWTPEENEEQDKAVLEVGEKLYLDGYMLNVTYSDGTYERIPITTDMLVNKDYYIPKQTGTVELEAAYGGQKIKFVTITYLERDIVTLKCKVGKHTVQVNGDGYAFDTYEIGPEFFKQEGGLASVLEATSSHNLEIVYEYSSFDEDDTWHLGLPEQAGSYVIRATTNAGENYIDGEKCIWIWSGDDYAVDYIVFDTTKINTDSYPNVYVGKYDFTPGINESYASVGWIDFAEEYNKDLLKTILDATISSYKRGKITYHYFAQGASFWDDRDKYYHEGLPEKPGKYCINIESTDSNGNITATARVYVNCLKAKLADVTVSVSSNNIECTVSDNSHWIAETTVSGNTVTKILKDGMTDQVSPIRIIAGNAYSLSISANGNTIDISNCYILKVTTYSENTDENGNIAGWSESATRYEGEGLPNESGRYRFIIPALATEDTAETWSSFVIIIE